MLMLSARLSLVNNEKVLQDMQTYKDLQDQ